MMKENIIANLTVKDDKYACAFADKIISESQETDKWYEYFDDFTSLLDHPKSLVRNRVLYILATNAQWDEENHFDRVIADFLTHITDEKPITARQCVKALAQVGLAKPQYIPRILSCLQSADLSKYKDSMRPLIEKDIVETEKILTDFQRRTPRIETSRFKIKKLSKNELENALEELEFRQADITDAELLIEIYNASFYNDYIKYGECPAYGKTKEVMEKSIKNYPKFIILCDGSPVGCVSCKKIEERVYEVGCLCVIPKFQGKGIGTRAIEFVKSFYKDWDKFTLITPMDKSENIKFYTEKCGFNIVSTERDGNVEVARFVLER